MHLLGLIFTGVNMLIISKNENSRPMTKRDLFAVVVGFIIMGIIITFAVIFKDELESNSVFIKGLFGGILLAFTFVQIRKRVRIWRIRKMFGIGNSANESLKVSA